jgi:hypothetical protein
MVPPGSRAKLLRFACLAALTSGLAACEVAPPTAERRPQTRPAASGPTATAPQAPTRPTSTQATASQPAAAEPEIPDYVTILERYNPQQRATVEVHPEPGNRLLIDTNNVRRLHIDRDRVPLDRRRSMSLQLDGQGVEWLATSKVEEFERTINGQWIPAKPAPRGKR